MKKRLQVGILALLIICLSFLVFLRTKSSVTSERFETAKTETSVVPARAMTDAGEKTNETQQEYSQDEKTQTTPDIDINDWKYILVNADNPLDDSFTTELSYLPGGQALDSRASAELAEMYNAAIADGLSILLNSGYRSIDTQRQLYEWRLNVQRATGMSEQDAVASTIKIVAYPGTSEHNLGLAIDILDKQYGVVTADFAKTKLGIWLNEHCEEYGFILRYPDGKTDITGVNFEPWHFRYVGMEAATYIMDNGLCLEEFLDLYENSFAGKAGATAEERTPDEHEAEPDATVMSEEKAKRLFCNHCGSKLEEKDTYCPGCGEKIE